jgi:hypothetical protein
VSQPYLKRTLKDQGKPKYGYWDCETTSGEEGRESTASTSDSESVAESVAAEEKRMEGARTGAMKPYAVGFTTSHATDDTTIYFGMDCIDRFISWLIENHGEPDTPTTWIAHNGGKFDIFLLMRVLVPRLNSCDWPKPEIIMSHGKILSLMWMDYCFIDSLNFLPGSLASLCRDFKVPINTSFFHSGKASP